MVEGIEKTLKVNSKYQRVLYHLIFLFGLYNTLLMDKSRPKIQT